MVDARGHNLVFIVSTPRAGSTLLGAMLGSHERVLCPPEPWLLLAVNAIRSPDVAILCHYDDVFAKQALKELLDDSTFLAAARAFATTAYNDLLGRAGKSVFVDKTPRYYHILEFLDTLFPEAPKVWLKRNPLDVVASCKETWGLSVDELMGQVVSPYTFDVTVSFRLLAIYFATPSKTKYVLTYEALVSEPEEQLRELCRFLGLSFNPQMIVYGSNKALIDSYSRATMGDKKLLGYGRPHANSLRRWPDLLSPSELEKILTTLGSRLFEELGYGASLAEAAVRAGLRPEEIPSEGNLPRLFDEYRRYVDRNNVSFSPALQLTLTGRQNAELHARYAECEADRAARLVVIEQQGREIARLQAEVHRWLEENNQAWGRVAALEEERANLQRRLADVEARLEASEVARAAREDILEEQASEIHNLRAEVTRLLRDIEALSDRLESREAERRVLEARLAEAERRLETARRVLKAIKRGRAYRILRRLGRWAWLEDAVAELSGFSP